VAVTLDAQITLVRQGGRRELAAKDFFQAAMTTALAPEELVLSVRFPRFSAGEASAFRFFNRRHGDFAVVAAAATVAQEQGVVQRVRLALAGVASMPERLDGVTRAFEDRPANAQWAHELAGAVAQAVQPPEDERLPASYRRELAHSLTLRALLRVLDKLELSA
jgi:carbon-monoxide dehydrogenase medium subunit